LRSIVNDQSVYILVRNIIVSNEPPLLTSQRLRLEDWGPTRIPLLHHQHDRLEFDVKKTDLVLFCVSKEVDIITRWYQTHTTRGATTLGGAARAATAVGARAGRHVDRWESGSLGGNIDVCVRRWLF
jgi:hypothetical protein